MYHLCVSKPCQWREAHQSPFRTIAGENDTVVSVKMLKEGLYSFGVGAIGFSDITCALDETSTALQSPKASNVLPLDSITADFRVTGSIPEGIVQSTVIEKAAVIDMLSTVNAMVGNFTKGSVFFKRSYCFIDFIIEDPLMLDANSFTSEDWRNYIFSNYTMFYITPTGMSKAQHLQAMQKKMEERKSCLGEEIDNVNLCDFPTIAQTNLKVRLHLHRGFYIQCLSTLFSRAGFNSAEFGGGVRGRQIKIAHNHVSDKLFKTFVADVSGENLWQAMSVNSTIDFGILGNVVDITRSFSIPMSLANDANIFFNALKEQVFSSISSEINLNLGFYFVKGSHYFSFYDITQLDRIKLLKDSGDYRKAVTVWPSAVEVSNTLVLQILGFTSQISPLQQYSDSKIFPTDKTVKTMIENHQYQTQDSTGDRIDQNANSVRREFMNKVGTIFGIHRFAYCPFAPGFILFTLQPHQEKLLWKQHPSELHVLKLEHLTTEDNCVRVELYFKSRDDKFERLLLPVPSTIEGKLLFLKPA